MGKFGEIEKKGIQWPAALLAGRPTVVDEHAWRREPSRSSGLRIQNSIVQIFFGTILTAHSSTIYLLQLGARKE
jgi:hypothetical protein